MKTQKQIAQILETIQTLVSEIAELKDEIAELKNAVTAKPATRSRAKK